ncbi:MAG: T9SS type A sorting domain-containing protein [Sphingobacteriales bacterium]|nr:MAG: T9SS type A sorting domain-containing protein [Sphingobacteriales bacterium]
MNSDMNVMCIGLKKVWSSRKIQLSLLAGILFSCLPLKSFSQTPDWSTSVAPIVYNYCTSCHHNGGLAPFSLTTYADAVTNATNMAHAVNLKMMPPWLPDPAYAHMAHERVLSDSEINNIKAWAYGGTPQGDPSLAPPIPTYNRNGSIPGIPDLVIRIPNYTSTADTHDIYQCFVIPSNLPKDKFIRSFEAIPGNNACVHHVLAFTDTSGDYAAMDAAYPGPGFRYFGGVIPENGNGLGIWVPGSFPLTCPPGFGIKIARHSDIVVQIHYPAGTAGLVDSTELHFFFAPDTGTREAIMFPFLSHEFNLINGPLMIPANTVKQCEEEDSIRGNDLSLLGIFPHMHLLGTSIKSYGVLPSGDTDRYISIPEWDFHWQNFYMFPKIKKVPAGTFLRAEAIYDNTDTNPDNPNRPPMDVIAGERTIDEMMLMVFLYANYKPGDENIIIDTGQTAAVANPPYKYSRQLMDIVTNPVVSYIAVKYYSEKSDYKTISLVDMQGRVIRNFIAAAPMPAGYSNDIFSVKDVAPGNYILMLKTQRQVLTKKVIIVSD